MQILKWSVLVGLIALAACDGGSNTTGSLSGDLIYPGNVGSAQVDSNSPNLDRPDLLSRLIKRSNNLHANEPSRAVPGEFIVELKPTLSLQSVQTLAVDGVSLQRIRPLAIANFALYRASNLSQSQTIALSAQLEQNPSVQSASPNWIDHAYKTPNDSLFKLQWHYPLMNLPAAWDIADGTSPTVTVAVADTGGIPHPDLQANQVGGFDFISDADNAGDGNGRDNNPLDQGGDSGYHGGHVAGTVAATTNNGTGVAGVSWGAKVVPIRVLGFQGGTLGDILDGIAWAAGRTVSGVPNNPNKAKIINLSLGSTRACSAAETTLFNSLAQEGIIIVVAAGNENQDANNAAPASCPSTITVGAVGPQGRRAPYSNFGNQIDVMASGGDTSQTLTIGGQTFPAGVISTIKDDQTGNFVYAPYQGTSMASPHIAGVVALMVSKDPTLNFTTALAKLKAASTPLSATNCNRPSGGDCGAGLVDVAKTLTGGTNPPPPPPPGPPAPPPPPTGTIKTYVVAFYCSGTATSPQNCLPFDEDKSQVLEITATKTRVAYKFSNLVPGPYLVAGWQDINGNVDVDNGEPFGAATTIANIKAGSNLSGYNVRLVPISFGTQQAMGTLGWLKQMEFVLKNPVR